MVTQIDSSVCPCFVKLDECASTGISTRLCNYVRVLYSNRVGANTTVFDDAGSLATTLLFPTVLCLLFFLRNFHEEEKGLFSVI